jgi:hypothetical protein
MTIQTDAAACLWLSRADLAHFLGDERAQSVPDAEFEWIARKVGDGCMDIFWYRLEELAKEYAGRDAGWQDHP